MRKNKKTTILLVCLAMLVSGCAGKPASTEGTASEKTVDTAAQKQVTIALLSQQTSLDPHTTIDGTSMIAQGGNIYNTLVDSKDEVSSEILPELATEWSVSDDNLVYTFKLRDNVVFHNGDKFTSADAKFSVERAMSEPVTASSFSMIDHVEAPDDTTLVITCKYIQANFLQVIGSLGGSIVSEKAVTEAGDNYKFHPIGTGPYKLEGECIPGQPFSLAAFVGYWGEQPQIQKINFKILPDASTAVIALQKGEVDFMPDLSVADMSIVDEDENLVVHQAPSFSFVHLTFNKSKPPFDNQKVREAIAKAVNKNDIIAASYDNAGALANAPLNSLQLGYTEDLPFDTYDLEGAKKLMEEAGYQDGFTTTVLVRTDKAFLMKVAQVLQAQLAEIGIDLQIEQMEKATWIEYLGNCDFDMTIGYLNWPSVDKMLSFLYKSDGDQNYDRCFNDPVIDEMLIKATQTMDTKERGQIYTDIIKRADESMVVVPLFFPAEIVGANAHIKGVTIYNNCYFPVKEWTLEE